MTTPLVEVEFRNVTLTVANVLSAREAYDLLTDALGKSGLVIEWTTDTFVEYGRQADDVARERPTSELWPEVPDAP